VWVSFVVTEEGVVLSPSVEKGLLPEMDAEAVRVIRSMPRWKPALVDGRPVRRGRTLTIEFRSAQDVDPVVSKPEVMPEFPKGEKGLRRFLSETLWYPDDARAGLVEGSVGVQFIVEKDGAATHPKVVRSLDPACDEEALRVIRMMPKWKPGTVGGKPVRVQMGLSLRFSVL